MKTWEIYRPENRNKRFRLGEKMPICYFTPGGVLRFINDRTAVIPSMGDEWEIVQEPVDFMTAIKSGRRIKVVVNDRKGEYANQFLWIDDMMDRLSRYSSTTVKEVILNGKWYIEGEE